jgi:hypothetical protein
LAAAVTSAHLIYEIGMIISMFLPSLDCCLAHAREADFVVAL